MHKKDVEINSKITVPILSSWLSLHMILSTVSINSSKFQDVAMIMLKQTYHKYKLSKNRISHWNSASDII